MKKALLFTIFFSLLCVLNAEKGTWKNKNYNFTVWYNKTSHPGDAVFARIIFTPKTKEAKAAAGKSGGQMVLVKKNAAENAKPAGKADFYMISADTKADTILAGIPLSSYLSEGDYELKFTYSAFGMSPETFSLPVVIEHKDFVSETIPLDAQNTSIKTNTSSERMDQIKRLNEILGRSDPQSVYETNAFVPPNPATRRTSFFADRRVYAYNNGKSSTSLHYGIDYGIPTGSEVRACGKGKVVMAENRISTGWSVCIEHLPGLYSLYYHMSSLNVKTGQTVNQGDLVGLSGATGLATGPHLHWEIRLNMEAVSPDFFTGDFTFEKESSR